MANLGAPSTCCRAALAAAKGRYVRIFIRKIRAKGKKKHKRLAGIG
mgnify:CR=1 FL=1